MLGQLGRWEEAVESAHRALELNPTAWQIHGWLAEVYARKGEVDRQRHHQRLFEILAPRTQ
jgi:Flp pilus assembly protein TadD